MRFRLHHILVLMLIVALFGAAMANPTTSWRSIIETLWWLVFAVLAVAAIAKSGRERVVILSALVMGLSYTVCTHQLMEGWYLPISRLGRFVFAQYFVENPSGDGPTRLIMAQIFNYGFSLIAASIGAGIGAYFTRTQTKK
jgi:hypothetical protein